MHGMTFTFHEQLSKASTLIHTLWMCQLRFRERQVSRLRLHDNYEGTQELNPGQCLSKALLSN